MLAKGHFCNEEERVQIECDLQDKNVPTLMADHLCDWSAIIQKWSENGPRPAVMSHTVYMVWFSLGACGLNMSNSFTFMY